MPENLVRLVRREGEKEAGQILAEAEQQREALKKDARARLRELSKKTEDRILKREKMEVDKELARIEVEKNETLSALVSKELEGLKKEALASIDSLPARKRKELVDAMAERLKKEHPSLKVKILADGVKAESGDGRIQVVQTFSALVEDMLQDQQARIISILRGGGK